MVSTPHEHRRSRLSSLVAHLLKRWPVRFFVNFHRSGAAIAGGLAHFTGLPYVTIDGDDAVVVSYLQILQGNPVSRSKFPITAPRAAITSIAW